MLLLIKFIKADTWKMILKGKIIMQRTMIEIFSNLKLKCKIDAKFFDNINNDDAWKYICNYFSNRSKRKILPQFTSTSVVIDKSRAMHMVSAFMLGIYIQSRTREWFSDIIVPEKRWDFEYLWFMCCLYHDTFSGQEKSQYGIYTLDDVFKEAANGEKRYTIYDGEIYGVPLPRPTYRKKDVEAYFRYRLDTGHLDHGIKGGYIAFQKLIDNYLEASAANGNQDCFQTTLDGKFRGHVLLWDKKQIEAFAYVADAIIAHNIWHVSKTRNEDDAQKYEKYKLSDFIVESPNNCPLTVDKSPLAYLLSLVDTIEPVKYFDKTAAECVLNNITISIAHNRIAIGHSDGQLGNFEEWYDAKMKYMSDWLFGIKTSYNEKTDSISIRLPTIEKRDRNSNPKNEIAEKNNAAASK